MWLSLLQVKFIPAQDLRVIDALWRAASGNKFGYSVQKEVWVQNRRYWERLFKAIDWVQGEYNMYRWEETCRCSPTNDRNTAKCASLSPAFPPKKYVNRRCSDQEP